MASRPHARREAVWRSHRPRGGDGLILLSAARAQVFAVVEQTGLSWGDEALAIARSVRDDTWAKEKAAKDKKAKK
jgi:hypothetical protein